MAEAEADAVVATDLAGRVLGAEVLWFQQAAYVSWQGLHAGDSFLPWRRVKEEAQQRRVVRHGKFRASPGMFDERRARLAMRLFLTLGTPPDGVILVRDTDAKGERKEILERFRDEGFSAFPVVLALPHPKLECWIIAGFEARDSSEETALKEARQRLGFDPRQHADRLSAEGKKGKKNAKIVLDSLAMAWDRRCACWLETDLEILSSRGARTGLKAYFEDLRERLLPLFF